MCLLLPRPRHFLCHNQSLRSDDLKLLKDSHSRLLPEVPQFASFCDVVVESIFTSRCIWIVASLFSPFLEKLMWIPVPIIESHKVLTFRVLTCSSSVEMTLSIHSLCNPWTIVGLHWVFNYLLSVDRDGTTIIVLAWLSVGQCQLTLFILVYTKCRSIITVLTFRLWLSKKG